MDFITSFFESAATIVTQFIDVLVNVAGGIGQIVYTPGVEGAPGELTIVGAALATGLGVGAVYLIFRMVRGLLKVNERG